MTLDDLKHRRKQECIEMLFYKRLTKMCEGIHKYFNENYEVIQKKREKE